MPSHSFPAEPESRRVVVVLTRADYERCQYEPAGSQALHDPEACVLPFPVPHEPGTAPALATIIGRQQARPGTMLIQSPFDTDLYEDAAEAGERFALAKYGYFSRFCMLLGAREVRVEQIEARTRTSKGSLEAGAEAKSVSGKVEGSSERLEKLRTQISLLDEFVGAPAEIEKAEALLRNSGLTADPNMRALLEMRRESQNELTARTLTLSLSAETRANLSVAARLKLPAFIKFSAEYEHTLRETNEYVLKVVVRFAGRG